MFIVIWKLVRRHSLIDCVHRPGAGPSFSARQCPSPNGKMRHLEAGSDSPAARRSDPRLQETGRSFRTRRKNMRCKKPEWLSAPHICISLLNNGAAVRPCIYLAGPVIQNPLAAVIYRPPAIACFCTARIACRFLRQLKISVHFPLSLCLPHPVGDNFFPCFPTSFLSIPEQHSAGEKPFHKNGCAGRGGVSASRPAHACPRAFVTNRSNSSVCGAPAPPNERELCR